MRFRLANPASADYLCEEAFLNNLTLIPVNSSTELVLGVAIVDSNGNNVTSPGWDYLSLTQAATTDTYTFKTGGAGGTTVLTIVITYTDSTKQTISTVVKS